MTKKPKLIPYQSPPELVLSRPKMPDRVTKEGLVLMGDPPSIPDKDQTIPEAVDLAIQAIAEVAGSDNTAPVALIMAWLKYIRQLSKFLENQ